MTIRLPKDPTELQYEDFVGAFILSRGYFIEPRIRFREGGVEILELDFVATPAGEKYLNRILIDAKSGAWGFGDVFKISGWVKFLQLKEGLVVHKDEPDAGKKETLERVKSDVKVDCCRLNIKSEKFPALPVCNELDEKAGRVILSAAWYALIAQRMAFAEFTRSRKKDPGNEHFRGATEYQRACEKSFFNRKAIERVHELCEAFKSNPNITGGFLEDIAEQSSKGTKEILYALSGDNGVKFEIWLQYIMLLEHKARIAIIKNSLDHLLDPAAQEQVFSIGTENFKWADIFLPESCRNGLESVKKHPHARRLPHLFQLFIEIFGGFYSLELKDDLDGLSKASGIPANEIPSCLELYNVFFPFAGGWFFTGKHNLRIMKMVPAISRGAGCLQRQFQFQIKDYYGRYGTKAGYVLSNWHNAFIYILQQELEVKEVQSSNEPKQ